MSSQGDGTRLPDADNTYIGQRDSGSWRCHLQRGDRTLSRHKPSAGDGARPWANHGSRGACESALKPRQAGKAHGRNAKVPNRNLGKPAVRDYRGPRETQPWWNCEPVFATERASAVNLHLQLARAGSIPTKENVRQPDTPSTPSEIGVSHGSVDVRKVARETIPRIPLPPFIRDKSRMR